MMNLETFAAKHGVKLNKLYTARGFNSCIRQASVANDAWIEWEDFFARWSGKDKTLYIELAKPSERDLLLELSNRMSLFGFKTMIDINGDLEVWGMGVYEEFNTERKLHPFQWLLLELEWVEEDYKVTKFDENGCPVLAESPLGEGFWLLAYYMQEAIIAGIFDLIKCLGDK